MTQALDNQEFRTKMLDIDERVSSVLRNLWPKIEPELGGILDRFYKRLHAIPYMASILGSESNIPRLIAAQKSHWKALFSAQFDQDFMNRVTKIGEAHFRIGLEPRLYMGGYASILDELHAVAARHCRRDRSKFETYRSAITRAVFLDMTLAVSVYSRVEAEAKERRFQSRREADRDFRWKIPDRPSVAERVFRQPSGRRFGGFILGRGDKRTCAHRGQRRRRVIRQCADGRRRI